MSEQQNGKKIIRFMAQRHLATALSLLLVIGSAVSLALNGLKFGLDFTGGTLIELGYSDAAPLQDIRTTIGGLGYNNAVVVQFGSETDILVRLDQAYTDELGAHLIGALKQDFNGEIELRRVEYVGPQVGEELKEQGGLAMLMALGVVMLYIAFRFQFKFSVGAVVALIHDVIITLGIFSFFRIDFDLTVLAAVLALIGYSINDTIVVFDRIRENFRKVRKGAADHIIDLSLTETLARTVVTGLTTLLVLVAMYLYGGETIRGFSIALIIGIVVGTYSSIYIAANILLIMKISKEDLILPVKEGAGEVDGLP